MSFPSSTKRGPGRPRTRGVEPTPPAPATAAVTADAEDAVVLSETPAPANTGKPVEVAPLANPVVAANAAISKPAPIPTQALGTEGEGGEEGDGRPYGDTTGTFKLWDEDPANPAGTVNF